MTNLRFVITGGPGAGKTTILKALAARGFQCVPDTARVIIKQRKEAGLSPRPAPAQFGMDMLQADIAQYQGAAVHTDPVFFDRGVCDAVSFLYFHDLLSMAEVATYIKEYPYNEVVFLLPPWPEIYRQDTERDQSFAEAIAVYEILQRWYTQWHYQLVEVPRGSVEDRAAFILQTIEERTGYKWHGTQKRQTNSDIP
jgi:predicted ATPase